MNNFQLLEIEQIDPNSDQPRRGIILTDTSTIKVFKKEPHANPERNWEFDKKYYAGDIVEVGLVSRKNSCNGEYYGLVDDDKVLWIDSYSVYLPEESVLEQFTSDNRIDVSILNPDDPKSARFNTLEFYQRMVKSPNAKTRSIAYRKLMWLSEDGGGLLENLEPFFHESYEPNRSQGLADLKTYLETLHQNHADNALEIAPLILEHLYDYEAANLRNELAWLQPTNDSDQESDQTYSSKKSAAYYLATAIKTAKAWEPDAALCNVSAGSFFTFSGQLESCDPAIPETGWTFRFWSPTTHRLYQVDICNEIIVGEGLDSSLQENIFDTIPVDTDKVGGILENAMKQDGCSNTVPAWSGKLLFDRSYSDVVWKTEIACNDSTMLELHISSHETILFKNRREEHP